MKFSLTEEPINIEPARSALLRLDAGGYCSFEGWVRNHHLSKSVTSLNYEAYASLAVKQGEAVIDQALEQFDILGANAIHRIGHLGPGDLAVWVGVCSVHRDTAFEACRHIIDEIKATVPIWKHEFYGDGSNVWVDPTSCHCAATRSQEEAKVSS
ncbi:molybdenum cofactor biosynthesis protein MoaE [Rubellicoccus peritrichatus]|uniref:Molybdopterin synthase catalytic subunit n=1 Tax=Rubellicoccus peritrichatus TaxID=3080537 RepID=A0AAQ3QST1_9BACT|nr:molybdenum cofactor biosynthesis protein MoaE [Puniceicoccus sp. CR14]WOO42893.1 molybdenum cofactor biosynthesis protein MoaE [Puniceicoccus sp. CR14]